MKRFIVFVMVFGALLASCSDDDKPGSTCPLVGDQGPALGDGGAYLLVANSLGEDWTAASLDASPLAPATERGLTGRSPNDMDVVGDRLYIVNSLDNNVSAVDLATGRTDACIALGDNVSPWEFAADPSSDARGWVTGWVSGELIELDLAGARVVRRVDAGPGAEGVLVTADRVAVTLSGYDGAENVYGNGSVVVFDKATLTEVARLDVPPNAQFIFPGADGRYHVVCTGNYVDVSGQVVRIEADWSAVRDTLALGGSPARASMTGGGGSTAAGMAYLTSYFGGILAYDTANFTVTHGMGNPVDDALGYMAVAATGDRLFAANFETDTVVEIDLNTMETTESFVAGDGPSVLAIYGPTAP